MFLLAGTLFAQEYSQRGFIESAGTYYPQKAINDSAQTVGGSLLRYEAFFKPTSSIQINGAIDLRTDTHHQVERTLHPSWWDREQKRPLAEVRRLSGVYHQGGLSIELGKQFVRWGKADILNPTDRFAPRDYLTVFDNDFLGVTAARAMYEKGSETIDVVWAPRLTPSRVPLPDQRWTVPPAAQIDVPLTEVTQFPGGSQEGFRWSHLGAVEFSGSFYQGFNHLPSFQVTGAQRNGVSFVEVDQFYPKLRMYGGDAAVPFRWLTLKTEAAYFTTPDPRVDQYAQYVIQLERQSGEWSFIGGYAGEAITDHGTSADFAPDRGITKTFLGSAHYTIDTNRSVAVETSIRQNLDGAWLRTEYSQTFGQHWRATVHLNLIRGNPSDFIGQYRRNSNATLVLRYSF
jgi:hypothetical protein